MQSRCLKEKFKSNSLACVERHDRIDQTWIETHRHMSFHHSVETLCLAMVKRLKQQYVSGQIPETGQHCLTI